MPTQTGLGPQPNPVEFRKKRHGRGSSCCFRIANIGKGLGLGCLASTQSPKVREAFPGFPPAADLYLSPYFAEAYTDGEVCENLEVNYSPDL